MPHCQHCGSFVTDFYEQVLAPVRRRGICICSDCEDELRDGTGIHKTSSRSPRYPTDG
ncbi:MAG TPA: hypothetical protein VFJ06_08875 [Halococcus sp.]|nr:hypothetical protein [Halococcus sp.]